MIPLPVDPVEVRLNEIHQRVLEMIATLKAQIYAQVVEVYDGNPQKFKEWIEQIEKYHFLMEGNEKDLTKIAFHKSKGMAYHVIECYREAHPQPTWAELKEELSKRFAPVSDSEMRPPDPREGSDE